MICTLTPTVQDGQVLRWYADETGQREIASASRNRVTYSVDAELREGDASAAIAAEVPVDVRDAAQAAHRELSRNRDADVRHYATHRRDRRTRQLVPIHQAGD